MPSELTIIEQGVEKRGLKGFPYPEVGRKYVVWK